MNVYSCWYQGIMGYCCRNRNSRWLFVPELGQPGKTIHRSIELDDLAFTNPYAKKYEIEIEMKLSNRGLLSYLKDLLFPACKPRTIGGLLFITI